MFHILFLQPMHVLFHYHQILFMMQLYLINSHKIGLTVKDGEIDKLVDVILSLKNSPTLVSSMEQNSHALLQEFSISTLASKFNDVLNEEILKKKNSKNVHHLTF